MCDSEKRKVAIELQYALQRESFNSGIGIVTCAQCGRVILHEIEKQDIFCPYCGIEDEQCHFPDYWNVGDCENERCFKKE